MLCVARRAGVTVHRRLSFSKDEPGNATVKRSNSGHSGVTRVETRQRHARRRRARRRVVDVQFAPARSRRRWAILGMDQYNTTTSEVDYRVHLNLNLNLFPYPGRDSVRSIKQMRLQLSSPRERVLSTCTCVDRGVRSPTKLTDLTSLN